MNRRKLYQSLALQWDLLDALSEPDSEQKQRKIRLGCLLLVLEGMRQTGHWGTGFGHLVDEYDA